MGETSKRAGRGGAGGAGGAGRGSRRNGRGLIVVGIGASAGGIGALERFFERMPADSGMAFVVILHLSPEHDSTLAEMLQRRTSMPVEKVEHSTAVEPNRVYVIPPAKVLTMEDGRVHVSEPSEERGRRAPVDLFFRTLGATYREHAIGVVLSGTGTDGTLGLRRIKEEGGVTIAQDPREAEHDGMPRSAIDEGLADFVLAVEQMPDKLVGIRETSEKIKLPPEGDNPPRGEELEALRDILSMMRVRTGHDFAHYKQTTILRRVTRRMQMHEVADLAGYLKHLRANPAELPDLQQDFLITVTSFFRDAAAFEYLEAEVVPKLFEGKEEGDHVRVWVTGCATGEEAYSIAILLAERAERIERPPRVQVFATDLDDESVAAAREGLYPETISADVSPERLRRFFTHERQYYRVKKQVREMVLFAPHNILRDPPFSKLDMVSCRNLLIYLNRETQDRVLEIFHFGLRPGGFLFLGSAESADSLPDLFAPAQKKLKVYRRTAVTSGLQQIPSMPLPGRWEPRVPPAGADGRGQRTYSYPELHRLLLEHYAPPSVLVNEAHEVVHVSESAGRYLRVPGGEPSRDLMAVVHPDLRLELRAALLAAAQEQREIVTAPVAVRLDDKTQTVRILVRPVARAELHATFVLILFDEAAEGLPAAPPGAGAVERAAERGEAVLKLEEELERMGGVLRATVEQYEISAEEMRASNEEQQATNEELRSAGEELETSKEELQSLNEELQTVNVELKDKIEEVTRVNTDLSNLLVATQIATVFLDPKLRITRYTPQIAHLFNVLPGDTGRPFDHVTHRLDYNDLPQDAARVLQTNAPEEREVRGPDGRTFAVRLLPYRTEGNRTAGVVITFVDVTALKQAEAEKVFLAAIVESSQDAIITVDFEGRITSWNKAAESLYGYRAAEALGRPLAMLALPEDLAQVFVNAEKIKHSREVEVYDTVHVRKDGRQMYLQVALSPVNDAAGQVVGLSVVARDLDKRRLTEALRLGEERERLLLESITDYAIFTLDTEGRITRWNTGAGMIFGFTEKEALGQNTAIIFTPEDRERGAHLAEMETARAHGRAADERWHVRKGGSRFYASGVLMPLHAEGALLGYVKVARDLTEQRLSEQQRAELSAQLEQQRALLEHRVEERTRELILEIAERRTAEERVKDLLARVVGTQELERRRISRDLHDQFGQQLTALRLNLEALKEGCGEGDPETAARIEQARAIAERLDAEVDFLAWELRPAALDEVGLAAALENFVHEWSEHFRVAAEYHTSGLAGRRLTQGLETNLYRIAQEALNNVAKHSGAKRVGVILEWRDRHVALIVEDDGRGFDPAEPAADGRGMGLLNMRERAALDGGTVEIESAPGAGATVFARVPARFAERE